MVCTNTMSTITDVVCTNTMSIITITDVTGIAMVLATTTAAITTVATASTRFSSGYGRIAGIGSNGTGSVTPDPRVERSSAPSCPPIRQPHGRPSSRAASAATTTQRRGLRRRRSWCQFAWRAPARPRPAEPGRPGKAPRPWNQSDHRKRSRERGIGVAPPQVSRRDKPRLRLAPPRNPPFVNAVAPRAKCDLRRCRNVPQRLFGRHGEQGARQLEDDLPRVDRPLMCGPGKCTFSTVGWEAARWLSSGIRHACGSSRGR
jgi:hypothetical protein